MSRRQKTTLSSENHQVSCLQPCARTFILAQARGTWSPRLLGARSARSGQVWLALVCVFIFSSSVVVFIFMSALHATRIVACRLYSFLCCCQNAKCQGLWQMQCHYSRSRRLHQPARQAFVVKSFCIHASLLITDANMPFCMARFP